MVEWTGMPDGLLTAKPLDGFRVRRAYALGAMLYPHVTEKEWIIFVRRSVQNCHENSSEWWVLAMRQTELLIEG